MEDSALPLVEVLVGRWTNVMLAECPFGHQQVEALSAVVEAWYGGCLTTRAKFVQLTLAPCHPFLDHGCSI